MRYIGIQFDAPNTWEMYGDRREWNDLSLEEAYRKCYEEYIQPADLIAVSMIDEQGNILTSVPVLIDFCRGLRSYYVARRKEKNDG